MIPYRISALALILGAVALGGCQQQQQAGEAEDVLATVNGQPITEEAFAQYLELRQARDAPAGEDPQAQGLEEMIDRILLTQRAEALGVDDNPDVRHLLARVRENILVQAMIRRTLEEQPISEDELRRRFQSEVVDTHQTEYRVSHILTENEDEAETIIRELKNDGDFAQLAREKSIDVQSGNKGGRLGWVNPGMVVPEFFEGVARLEKGAITDAPVKSEFGWHVIRLEDTRPAKIPTFEEFMADPQTKANFQRKLQDERIEQIVQDLRAEAEIEIKGR